MSLKAAAVLFVMLMTQCMGCLAAPPFGLEINLQQSTTEIEGWFSAKGEWILFPLKNFEDYEPLNLSENNKCVSLINATGSNHSQYQALEGKKVSVTGVVVRYEGLPIGVSVHDRLLSKRYYKDEPVENYCLRDLVFVVTSVRAL